MSNINKTIAYTLVIAGALFFSCGSKPSKEEQKLVQQEKSLTEKIGERFTIGDLKDSTSNLATLDFSKSDVTIIDFWFNDCPPCIDEMKQFAELLSNTKSKVSIVSISIN